jgi:transcriptional regulator with XRE-family HTH domain
MPRRDPVLAAFGLNVRRRREEIGLTQEDLADRAGLDRSYISNVERGSRNLSISSIVRIAKALRTSASELCRDIHRKD